MSKYNKLPNRRWIPSGRMDYRTGIALWYSVPRREAREEEAMPIAIERVSDEELPLQVEV